MAARFLITAFAAVLFSGSVLIAQTGEAAQTAKPKILAIGDSLMAWHRGEDLSIADSLAAELGEPVLNRAVSGARIVYALPISGAMGMRISNQFRERERYDWVIVTGGGNDFMLGCGCARCERRMNKLLTADTKRGDVLKLIARIRKTGAQVIYLGYLRSPGMGSPIEKCKDEGDVFEARLAALAERDNGIHFHSIAQLVPSGDRSFHSFDMIHPSKKASTIIGKQIAQIIKRADQSR
ncbi:SGNH/GDSL hydrolase family protein [Lentibacter sp. XHP0401]|jgi:lysophospholipase L1-like esterase|uniref:SGNH/GDSL hydrolase family protein n=1 Tax=Lentibacter sp. XHP0401 TaxID=2984334 RepID=UPI0021E94DA0|nr:SGNH/GDSL hydrolase family protein [Lentibacter sp. XHP0401]MCV2893573.1 SGNH/GDSL hydrolase family protein [Lentibacter sp. XHP0401]